MRIIMNTQYQKSTFFDHLGSFEIGSKQERKRLIHWETSSALNAASID